MTWFANTRGADLLVRPVFHSVCSMNEPRSGQHCIGDLHMTRVNGSRLMIAICVMAMGILFLQPPTGMRA